MLIQSNFYGFVDLFDIALFGVLRVPSLNALGVTDPQAVLEGGVRIYNAGMIGMMIGGVLWGVLADKIGRLSVLFGSILIIASVTIPFLRDLFDLAPIPLSLAWIIVAWLFGNIFLVEVTKWAFRRFSPL